MDIAERLFSLLVWIMALIVSIIVVLWDVRAVEVNGGVITIETKRFWGTSLKKQSVHVQDVASIYSQKGRGRNSAISTLVVELKNTHVWCINDFVNTGRDEAERVADMLRLAAASGSKSSYRYECIPRWKLGWLVIIGLILFCRSCASLLTQNMVVNKASFKGFNRY